MDDTRRQSYEGTLTKRSAPTELKAEKVSEGIVSSYDSIFYEVDYYGEFTVPGCFAKTITDRGPESAKPRILLRYEHWETIGNYVSMAEDEVGLFSEGFIVDDGSTGSKVRKHLQAGVPYGKSIGFKTIKRRSAEEADLEHLKLENAPTWVRQYIADGEYQYLTALEEVMLYESSVVSFPAVESIVVQEYRSDLVNPVLERALSDLKSGRLGEDQMALIRQIAAALPVDGKPGGSETLTTPLGARAAEPRIRNRNAELALAMAGVQL